MPADRHAKNLKSKPPRKSGVVRKNHELPSPHACSLQLYRRTNDEPMEGEEIAAIQSVKESWAERLASLDVSILKKEQDLERLRKSRNAYQDNFDLCHSALSVVRRVPVDIWREIFLLCHPHPGYLVMSFSKMPLLLTQVCRSWRSIAHSTPQLWTRLYIPPFDIPADPIWSIPVHNLTELCFLGQIPDIIYERCHLLQTVLNLSGLCPLSITMVSPRMHEYRPFRAALGITQTSRQPLEPLILNIFIALSRVYDILESHIPRVEEVSISRCMIDHISEMDTRNLLSSPRLRILRINSLQTMKNYPNFIPSNWGNLTTISIGSPSSISWVKALFRHCAKLVECSLNVQDSNPADPEISRIKLPDLKALSITEVIINSRNHYAGMVIPNIKSLNLYELNFPTTLNAYNMSLMGFLPQLRGLQKLQINPAIFTDVTFPHICRSLPSVNHLVLGSLTHPSNWASHMRGVCNIFRFLSSRYYPMPDTTEAVFPLPNLQFLEIHNVPIADAELRTFIDAMLCQQCPSHPRLRAGVARLRNLTATFKRFQQVDIKPDVVNYARKAGVAFSFRLIYPKTTIFERLSTQYGSVGALQRN